MKYAYEGLSSIEMRILALIAQGLTNIEIGNELGYTDKTVKNYVSRIYLLFGVTSRFTAVAHAFRTRILDPIKIYDLDIPPPVDSAENLILQAREAINAMPHPDQMIIRLLDIVARQQQQIKELASSTCKEEAAP
jgi:DNA-binding CsgD family transcriptional regulator